MHREPIQVSTHSRARSVVIGAVIGLVLCSSASRGAVPWPLIFDQVLSFGREVAAEFIANEASRAWHRGDYDRRVLRLKELEGQVEGARGTGAPAEELARARDLLAVTRERLDAIEVRLGRAEHRLDDLDTRVRALEDPSPEDNSFQPLRETPEESIRSYIEFEYLQDREKFDAVVDYYDKGLVDRNFIAKDKRTYATRWPIRQYSLVPGTLQILQRSSDEYVVTFDYAFSVSNAKKSIDGRGRSQVRLRRDVRTYFVTGVKEIVARR